MSETSFPLNDLSRRRLQTVLAITTLALSVASTLFLLLFADRVGFNISLTIEDRLTLGFSTVFSRFVIFAAVLIFVVGAVIISFMVFVMMSQRVKDIGLLKAAGCPNDLLFGYFFTELLIVALVGCVSGVALGVLADIASTNLSGGAGLQFSQKPINFWLVPLVFGVFFIFALILGTKPILDATRVEPAKAISPMYSFGLTKEPGFNVISKSGFTMKMALRGLSRHLSATVRVTLCLTTIFILITVAVAGGIIANQTSQNWVENAVGKDVVVVGHKEMCDQFELLLARFYESRQVGQFNYIDQKYSLPEGLADNLSSITGVTAVDARLVTEANVTEISGYLIEPDTQATVPIGDTREGGSVVIGLDPAKTLNQWFLDGEFLKDNESWQAVIGDSISQSMFTMPLNESIEIMNKSFDIVGVCLDPINNGKITYVPLKALQNATGISRPNIVMIRIDPSSDRTEVLTQIRTSAKAANPEFDVLDLQETLNDSLDFLNYVWATIMLMPLIVSATASLSLFCYVILTINDQQQEFGIIRAVCAKPGTVAGIISMQSFIVLILSYGAGVGIGTILTLMILMQNPMVTSYSILEIVGWLLIALTTTFCFSLYPAIKFSRRPILEIMAST
jgi:ABC-type antimicrobial peptide transport system permease subunit